MGLRFRKSIKLLPGVKLNLGTKSASVSVGKKGIHQSFSTTGRTTTSIGIPGTGVSYVKSINMKTAFKKLFKKKGEKAEEEKKSGAKAAAAAPATKAQKEAQATYEAYREQIENMKRVHTVADKPVDWNKEKGELAKRILAGDTDAYLEAVEAKRPFDDLLEYGSGFEVGTDDPTLLEVEFGVKSEDVIPELEYVLDAKGNLKEKELSKSAYYELVQDYVCSAILRVARDSFALLPVDKVIVHATDKVLNTATGMDEDMTIVSVLLERDRFENMNFEKIDPSDAVTACVHKMNFKKTKGFEAVDRISLQ